MQRLEVSGAVRHIYESLGFKGLMDLCELVQKVFKKCRCVSIRLIEIGAVEAILYFRV